MFYECLFAQILMGGAAALMFIGALSLVSAAGNYLQALANKTKAETALLIATVKRARPSGNGSGPSV